jgi:hypothetical protein
MPSVLFFGPKRGATPCGQMSRSADSLPASPRRCLCPGGLLGLGPVLLAETGILVAGIPGITGLAFALLAVAVSPGLFCGDVLRIVLLLVIRATRSIGIGLAVGCAGSCTLVWLLVAHDYFNGWFG